MSMDKIANYYYNLGAQHAHSRMSGGMRKTAAPSGKALAKALGIGGGAALSPALLHELSMAAGRGPLGGQIGAGQSEMLRALLAGEGSEALRLMQGLPGYAANDAAAIGSGLGRLRTSMGNAFDNLRYKIEPPPVSEGGFENYVTMMSEPGL